MKNAARMLALGLLVLPLVAVAQLRQDEKLTAKVPFEFVIGNRTVPAGQWAVQSMTGGASLVSLSNRDEKVAMFSNTIVDESPKPAAHYALVFRKYGDRHFLAAIKTEGSTIMYRLPEGKAEAELRAQNVTSTDEILLAQLN